MPEGDTIHRTAASLRGVLEGQTLQHFAAPRLTTDGPAPGTCIEQVEARGKHLLVHFADGLVLHTHLRMDGSWHVYRPGRRWRRDRRAARAVITVDAAVAVCFAAPVVELLDVPALQRHPTLRSLGPDLCLPEVAVEAIVARARQRQAGRRLAPLLLDQRVATGVGNVYAAEVCFVAGHHPATKVGKLDDGQLAEVFTTAARLLQANLEPERGRRTTVAGGRPGQLYVYGRAGRPCRRCDTPVATGRLGRPPRSSYWCPGCQPHP